MSEVPKYPYGLVGKLAHYPWADHWRRGRAYRFTVYSLVVCMPVFYQIHKAVNSPANVKMWQKNREARLHDHFAPPHE